VAVNFLLMNPKEKDSRNNNNKRWVISLSTKGTGKFTIKSC